MNRIKSLFKPGQIITVLSHSRQWNWLEKSWMKNDLFQSPILLHDNIRPLLANPMLQTLMELEWGIIPLAAYSLDLLLLGHHSFHEDVWCDVIVIDAENGIGDPTSNSGSGCLRPILYCGMNVHKFISSGFSALSIIGKIVRHTEISTLGGEIVLEKHNFNRKTRSWSP